MKHIKFIGAILAFMMLLTACGGLSSQNVDHAVEITLQDAGILIDGAPAGEDSTKAVYTARDIIYYESGKDFIYGEGSEKDAHSKEAADAHTVVHITRPGVYSVSGKLSKGQIAVDLGPEAKTDPQAVVTLILNGVDITCEVAPAVIFYSVYECGSTENPSKDVDTSKAGANVIIADGTENFVNGAYVARIYKPDTVVLNGDNTAVAEAKKLHKYDGAFYSKMSMNVNAEKNGSGILHIRAENEGLDSELHLTVNGGIINISSGNDGINTNEDGVSVTTINGGVLNIQVTGKTGEGDGIDSNGYLVINGGTVIASACSDSADAGVDSDKGIYINGGTVIATGHMLDRIENGGQTYAVFHFTQKQKAGETVTLKKENGDAVLEYQSTNDYAILIYSSPTLEEGVYTLWSGAQQLTGQSSGISDGAGKRPGGGSMRPDGANRPEGSKRPEGMTRPDGTARPEGTNRPTGAERPGKQPSQNAGNGSQEGFTPPPQQQGQQEMVPIQRPQRPGVGDWVNVTPGEVSPLFQIVKGANMFSGISYQS